MIICGDSMNTPGSWHFQLLNFPIKVHFSFFLIAILLGLGLNSLPLIAIWVAIVFVSILLHELGHAITSEYYGRAPHIELYSMGGLTISTRYSLLSYPKEILISFSGPLAGFLLGGILFLIQQFAGPFDNFYLNFIIGQLLWVNIGWGIINLIPILPLDGGSIVRNLYHWLKNPYDERTPLIISIFFGILAVIAALLVVRSIYMALLAAWLTYNNYTALRKAY
jgi:stage IV sporulation protein FB